MSTPNWHFRNLPTGQNHNDSVDGDFFSLEDLKEEALPRESGQNSKDQLVDSEEKLVMKIALYDGSEHTIGYHTLGSSDTSRPVMALNKLDTIW